MQTEPATIPIPRPLVETHITPAQLCQLLAVTDRTLAQWRASSSGPPFIRVGGRFWYPRAGVTAYFEKLEKGAA